MFEDRRRQEALLLRSRKAHVRGTRLLLAFVNVSRQDIFLADETWDILHQQKQDRQVFCVLTGEACDVLLGIKIKFNKKHCYQQKLSTQ